MNPVLVPAQITPPAPGADDGASDVIEPPGAGAPTPVAAPAASAGAGVPGGRERSGLIARHVLAPSLDASTYCAAMYSVCLSGENASGGAPPNRSRAVG